MGQAKKPQRTRTTQQSPVVALAPAASNGHRVFAREGEPVSFAGRTLHLGVLTVYGTMRLQDYLGTLELAPDTGATLGSMVIRSAMLTRRWEPVYGLFDLILTAPFPRGAELDADPDELQDVLNRCFEHAGFGWMERLIKNWLASKATLIEDSMQTLLTTLEATTALPTSTSTPTEPSSAVTTPVALSAS